ncbi:VanZ family protein [Streptomyces sp. NBC_00370]|uniref:VanZ family protein n=1 Tax=Streptomyces sp. NBC_00370 TaxID=2975728 RepID=UPI002E276993
MLILVVAFVALVAFSVVLAELTLTPSPASAQIAGSNLHPGRSLRQYLEDYTFLAACKQIGGNIVMGVPFGLILPVLVPRRLRMIRVVLLTAVVMVLVELAQGSIVEGRAFDVDDVIMNTSGALIGYLLLGRRIGRKYHSLGVAPVERDSQKRSERTKRSARSERSERSEPKTTVDTKTERGPASRLRPKSKPTTKAGTTKASTKTLTKPKTAKPKLTPKATSAKVEAPSWSERINRLARSRR